jgi:hypothetical protein
MRGGGRVGGADGARGSRGISQLVAELAVTLAGRGKKLAQPTRVFTALVSSARAALASAKYMLVLGSV